MGVASESSTVRSLNMKFHEFGDKNLPPILLIHGGGSSWWNYLRQARILSEEYRIILPTLNGHGEEYQLDYVSTEYPACNAYIPALNPEIPAPIITTFLPISSQLLLLLQKK